MKKKELDPKEVLRKKVVKNRARQNKKILNFLSKNRLTILENVDALGNFNLPHPFPSHEIHHNDILTM